MLHTKSEMMKVVESREWNRSQVLRRHGPLVLSDIT